MRDAHTVASTSIIISHGGKNDVEKHVGISGHEAAMRAI